MSADRFKRAASVNSSGSWNKYAYVLGDPVNWRDPRGRDVCPPDSDTSMEICDQDPGPGNGDGPSYCDVNPSDPSCGGTGSGGPVNTYGAASTPIVVTNFSNSGAKQDAITGVLNKIDKALSTNTDCANWLQGGGSTGSALIEALVSNNSYGYGSFNVNTVAAFAGSVNSDGSSAGVPSSAAFTVNATGAFFTSGMTVGIPKYQGGTIQADATILIHELAHILGAAGFQSDAGNAAAGKSNDTLVNQNCGKLIGSLQ